MRIFKIAFLLFFAANLASCNIYKEVEVREVKSFQVTNFTLKKIDAEIELEIYNPNWYKVKLVNTDVDLFVNDKYAGKVTLDERLVIPRKSDEVQKISLTTDVSAAGATLMQTVMSALLFKKVKIKAEGEIKGKAMLVGKKVFISFEDDVDLDF